MAAYFSFRRLITPFFVRTIYTIGFALLTAGGVGWAVWAGMRLHAANLPTRQGIYYIAIGAGILIVGNLAWRMICEFWLLLFKVHGLLASIEQTVRGSGAAPEPAKESARQEVKPESLRLERPEPKPVSVAPSRGILGLS